MNRFLLLLLTLTIFTCGDPSSGEDPVKNPSNVSVALVEGKTVVSWDSRSGESYTVTRIINNGASVVVVDNSSIAEFSEDVPDADTISYGVQAHKGGASSEVVFSVEPLMLGITNAKAAKLKSVSTIDLNWDANPHADSYSVFRSTSSTGSFVQIAEGISSFNYSDSDSTLLNSIPYYYKIKWSSLGYEYGDSQIIVGAIAESIDLDEPSNDSINTVVKENYFYDPLNPPMLYCFALEDGSIIRDVDWYVYKGGDSGINKSLYLQIKLPADTSFNSGEVEYRYLYKNVYSDWQQVFNNREIDVFNSFVDTFEDENDLLFVQVRPGVGVNTHKISKYEITIGESLNP